MKKIKHILLLLALAILAAIFYLSADKLKDGAKTITKDLAIGTNASTLISGVTYVKSVKGVTEFKIIAESAEYYKDDGRAKFDTVDAEFYAKDGKGYKLTGSTGEYDSEKEDILIKGDVVLLSGDGYELTTDSLLYSQDGQTLVTDDPVKIKKGDLELEGVGMSLDIEGKKLMIHKDVKGRIAGS